MADDINIRVSVSQPSVQVRLGGPPGPSSPGTPGAAGDDGWSPILAVEADGERRVLRLVDWTGGGGTKPTAHVGEYVGPAGLVSDVAAAVDVRGAVGAAGADGADGEEGQAGLDGLDATVGKIARFRIIGDSIASQNDTNTKAASGSTTTAMTRYPFWWNMTVALGGQAVNAESVLSVVDNLRYGSNSGIGGEDMDELLERLPSVLATMPEDHLIIVVGTNDINAGASLASLNTNFVAITNMVLAAGVTPIWTTVLPRNAVDGANDWGATGSTAAQKRRVVAAHNAYRMRYCRERGLRCCPWHSVFSDAAGVAITGYTADSVHPSGKGSYALAQAMMATLADLLPRAVPLYSTQDVYDATYNPSGNILNGALSGSGGTTSVGSGSGTITGTIPDNFQLAKSTSTTTSVAAAIVPRTDGKPGNVLELTFTSLGTGNASENWRLNYWSGSTTSLSGFAQVGDLLQMDAEIEYVGGHGGIGKAVSLRNSMSGATTKTGTTISFDAATNRILDSANGFGSFVANRTAVISGAANGANNRAVLITAVSAGALTLDPSTPVVNEAAGANVTVLIPSATTATAVSTTTIPDETTPVIFMRSPILEVPFTGNIVPRLDIFVNGAIAGTYKVRIARPQLRKLPFRPALMDVLANDN